MLIYNAYVNVNIIVMATMRMSTEWRHVVLGDSPGIQKHEGIDLVERVGGAIAINVKGSDEPSDFSGRRRNNFGDLSA